MVAFQPDTSFTRRRRRRGVERRPLAAVLTDPGAPTPAAPATPAAATAAGGHDAPTAEPAEPVAAATAAPSTSPPAPNSAEQGAPEPSPSGAATVPDAFGEAELAALLAGAATEARAAAAGGIDARLAAAAAAVATALEEAAATRERTHRADAELVLELVRTITAHVVPKAIAAVPLDDLLAELPALLARLDEPERVAVAVHPDLAPALSERLADVATAAGFAGTLEVRGDDTLEPGAAAVTWPAGGAERSPTARREEAIRLCADWLAERTAGAPAPAAVTTPSEEAADEH